MASKNEKEPANANVGVPDGFQRAGTAPAVGWFHQGKVGNVFFGKLTGMFERPDTLRKEGTSKFFQVELYGGCEVRAERGQEAKLIQAKAGEFINLNYGPKTKPLESFIADVKNGAVYEVWGKVMTEKVKISAGRTMHNLDVRYKLVSPPKVSDEDVEEEPDFEGADAGQQTA